MTNSIKTRHDFVLLFDIKDGNPNGDPDAGNLPRIDAETGHGLITDVCLKRKVRNYIAMRKEYKPPFDIYIKEKTVLVETHKRAYEEDKPSTKTKDKKRTVDGAEEKARMWICKNFYDVRTFGAVMVSKKFNCGQVRGPVQITFARSITPIIPLEYTITRMAVTSEEQSEKQQGGNRTMGRKHTVPYGLYRAHGFISAHLAEQTGFSDEDRKLLLEALQNMFEHDRSAARGEMNMRGVYLFTHDNKLGNAPAHRLFERIIVKPKDEEVSPRNFDDYTVSINEDMPEGVSLEKYVP